MKLLFDLLPVALFFAAFKLTDAHRETAATLATQWFGRWIAGGAVAADQAPIVWATLVAIVATLAQVGWKLARGQRVDPMLWFGLVLVVTFGGATIWLHDPSFIQWKPTILYWGLAAALFIARLVFRKNLVESAMRGQIELPRVLWERLLVAWVVFLGAIGGLNLYVASHFDLPTWVSFKLFGFMGLMFAFVFAQALWIGKYVRDDDKAMHDGGES